MSTASVDEIRVRSDENALRVVRSLMGWHGLTMPDIAAAIGQSVGTVERRLSWNPKVRKGFLGYELDALAAYFGVPVQAFHTGEVDVKASRLGRPAEADSQPTTEGYLGESIPAIRTAA